MIDNFSILLSCFALAFVIRQAIKLDAIRPWFKPATETPAEASSPVGSLAKAKKRGTR